MRSRVLFGGPTLVTGDAAVNVPECCPSPRVPLLPVPSWGTFFGLARWTVSSVLDAMIDPASWTWATPVYYRVREDTSEDPWDIELRVNRRTHAIMVPHYFGFPQRIAEIRAFCDRLGLVLLEDCAHAFLGEHEGVRLGALGDYTIASPPKFFPIYEGGLLASDRRSLDRIRLTPLGWKFSLRAAVILFERSLHYKRFGLAGRLLAAPLWLKTELLQHTSRARVASTRRNNYRALLERRSVLPGMHPLFPALPQDVVPFVFPLVVDEPDPVFDCMKFQGMPIVRFGEYPGPEVDARTYPEAVRLSRTVFQFPCHQELTPGEIDWIVETIRKVRLVVAAPRCDSRADS